MRDGDDCEGHVLRCLSNLGFSVRYKDFKGTVARDFFVSVFFVDLLYMGP
jgi:hypothetical protein